MYACPGETLHIMCMANDTRTLSWISEDYIDGVRLDVGGHYQHRAHNYSETSVVVRVNTSYANGTSLLTSILTVTVLPNIMDHNHTITCQNVDIGTASRIIIEREGTFFIVLYYYSNLPICDCA